MEVTRVYPKGNPYSEETRVRKNIDPNVIISHEETLGDDSKTTIITAQEVFMIDGDYDAVTEMIRINKLTEGNGGTNY